MRQLIFLFIITTFVGARIISTPAVQAELSERIQLPVFQKESLLNGLEFLFFQPSGERGWFVAMAKNGAAFDPTGKWGATELMVRSVMQQTQSRTNAQLWQDIAAIDLQLEYRVDWDAIFFEGSFPHDQTIPALAILSEMVAQPKFDEQIFQRLKGNVLNELHSQNRQLEALGEVLIRREVFGLHPYGHTVLGIPETVSTLELSDVIIQYRKLMMPNQTQVAVATNQGLEDVTQRLGRSWGGWTRGKPAPFSFRQASPRSTEKILLKDVPDTTPILQIGALTVERSETDFFSLEIFSQYLRLVMPSWAEKIEGAEQLRADVRFEARRMPGHFQLSIQSQPQNLMAYLEEIRKTLHEAARGELDQEILSEARTLAFLEFKEKLGQPKLQAKVLLDTNLYGLGVNHITTYGLRLARINSERLASSVKLHLDPNSLTLLFLGPSESLLPHLERLGAVEIEP